MKSATPTLLIIDDDDIDAKAVQRFIQKSKYPSIEQLRAFDGVEALAILRANNNLNRSFIIILDINMPRLNGIDFLAELRADHRLKDLPVIVLTTSDDEKDHAAVSQFGIIDYCLKDEMAKALNVIFSLVDAQ